MSLHIDIAWLLATILVSVRIAGATMLIPVFGPTRVPATARVVLAVALSAFLVAALPSSFAAITDAIQFASAALTELFIGLAFAFGFLAPYAATQVAGRALDIQIGFGAAGVLNPATQTYSPLLGSVFGMLAICAFLAMDGHLLLLKALAASIVSTPPGTGISAVAPQLILKHSATIFTFGFSMAGPVMFLLLLSDIAMAVFARSMPQLNVFVLGFAIKIVLGLTGIAIGVRFAGALFDALFSTSFQYWDQLAVKH